ncbi:hypothetical protein [Micromonospora aurantiaca (nom. illeg.)]|uniref:hypothetical protein n=1 Tax=Micromonospora aurantiaca (nom. illeg.) TaxID=47850 RepID=UPI003EBBF57F
MPALDQTRTVGLVTLPGAFVGVLPGGGTAVGWGGPTAGPRRAVGSRGDHRRGDGRTGRQRAASPTGAPRITRSPRLPATESAG